MSNSRSLSLTHIAAPEPSPTATLVQVATNMLREEIIRGRIAGGSRIGLVETAALLGMSPIPIREALRNLAAEGLVDPLPQRGFRVRPISLPDLDDIYRVRLLIEPMAMRLAIPRLNAQNLREIDLANRRLLDAAVEHREKPHRLAEYHHAFHFSIYNHCGSPLLIQFSEQLWKHSERYARLALYHEPNRVAEHGQILAACQQGDIKLATRELTAHLRRSHRRIRAAAAPHLAGLPSAMPVRERSVPLLMNRA